MESLLVLLLLSYASSPSAQDCSVHYDGVTQHDYMYYTASTVSEYASYINSVEPPIGLENIGYLSSWSCLGQYGPIGSVGPLGQYGPLGDDTWSPATWITGMGWDWSSWSDKISGPLSREGPLGPNGPVSDYWYNTVCPCINNFAHHMMNGGVWSILGPMGPLGALGPLGPLGRIGAHGYARNDNGQYVTASGNVVKTVSVGYSDMVNRTFSLYEEYDHIYALKAQSLDTSWYVKAVNYNDTNPTLHTYNFVSSEEQYVYILVVPYSLVGWVFQPAFTLTVDAGRGKIVSDETLYIQWISIKVPAGKTKISVAVSGDDVAQTMAYALYVTGSTANFPKTDIVGDYQKLD